MQLLQITVKPAKYELEIENARLEQKHDYIPTAEVEREPLKLRIDTEQTSVRIDTYEARKSLGIMNAGDQLRMHAERGRDAAMQQMRANVEEGAQMAQIEDGVTIGQIINQKMLEQPSSVTVFLPSTGAEISWDPGQIDMSFNAGKLEYQWNKMENSMQYIPGSVRVKIIERPTVEIEYLGGPMYIPPSADPEYEEKEAGQL
ncbi:MAG: hypothetical protein ABT01_01920 [Clostridium sp. SCN 57-10]|nr:MAG: hypothetical protein ABT01_01920 [Clostridium sp. SCN 57-10]